MWYILVGLHTFFCIWSLTSADIINDDDDDEEEEDDSSSEEEGREEAEEDEEEEEGVGDEDKIGDE